MQRLTSSETLVAALMLRQGRLVGVPTETVYGLAANGLDPIAVARIYTAKGRPADNPLILHVDGLAAAWPLWSLELVHRRRATRAAALWPGPLTLVLPASSVVPAIVTAGLSTVAVRVPDHPVTLSIISEFGAPIAAPSANRSGRPSPTLAAHVVEQLEGRIDAVIDGGPCRVGVESTVVDLGADQVRILRPGAISPETLEAVLGETVVRYDSAFVGASPGLRHRHYRPDVSAVVPLTEPVSAWRSTDALIVFASTAGALAARLGTRTAHTEVLPDSASGAMQALYAALVAAGGSGAQCVQIELPDVERHPGSAWDAVRDRLGRATR
ncbi:MAG: L-threonylcarbamoyladenylate synthase [Myxococcota bacterium]